ncbi:MAG TPA: DNA-directed RNA polymerase subunit omega [bacterium]|nr:DNA-directed RNA polymerase subunit omega [bacterium]
MHTPPLEELLAKVPGRYALVNVVAVRARQLIAGDLPAVETTTRNPVLIAIEELASGRLHLESRRTPVALKQDPGEVHASQAQAVDQPA